MESMQKAIYIDFNQAHKLVTKEDGDYMHIHKTLGILTLSSFIYRSYALVRYNDMQFNNNYLTILNILIHFMLHISSFEFILLKKRNKAYPIIWAEYRWHSLIFAYRSLITLLSCILLTNIISEYKLKLIRSSILISTMVVADYVTMYYKKKDMIEKNDSTMRGMPFPSYINDKLKNNINLFYSISQVFATMIILSKNIDAIYLTLIPIHANY